MAINMQPHPAVRRRVRPTLDLTTDRDGVHPVIAP